AALAVAALAGAAWYAFGAISSQPIERVTFAGDMSRIAPGDLETFAHAVTGGSAGTSLDAVRDAARKIPWVRDASVRRRFPDAVEVTFQVHEPLARWNDAALVSTRGEVFSAAFEGTLPRFRGRDSSAALMASEYPAIARSVAPLSAQVVELSLSPRGAWEVVLDSGLVLEVGRDDIESRLARFAQAWPLVSARALESKHADLRYANGFALTRVAELKNPEKKKAPR
ncbi:MAG TPA: cell division protein FtsQ/DivIB, partial [Usitatibacter sp.]|nr:cell division protein FtsQ/DivIB [Usitatibacter sp.]